MGCLGQNKQGGYTLIEILVSMGIAMVILGAVSNSFVSQSKAFNAQEAINEMQQNARAAMDLMVREIKMAGYDPNGAGFVAIETFAANTLRFRADVAGGAGIDTLDEDITYSRDGANQLLRDDFLDGADPVLMAENIINLGFEYFIADGVTAAATAGDIRLIKVTVNAQTSKPDPDFPDNGGYRTYSVTSWVTPNNLGY